MKIPTEIKIPKDITLKINFNFSVIFINIILLCWYYLVFTLVFNTGFPFLHTLLAPRESSLLFYVFMNENNLYFFAEYWRLFAFAVLLFFTTFYLHIRGKKITCFREKNTVLFPAFFYTSINIFAFMIQFILLIFFTKFILVLVQNFYGNDLLEAALIFSREVTYYITNKLFLWGIPYGKGVITTISFFIIPILLVKKIYKRLKKQNVGLEKPTKSC